LTSVKFLAIFIVTTQVIQKAHYCRVNLKMTDKSVGQTFLSVVYLKRTNESGKNARQAVTK